MIELWTAFTIGLLGSLHCVGMCGPIAVALPYPREQRVAMAAHVLIYHGGRILTYGFLGLLVGLIGRGLFIAGIQAYFSIGLGILLILAALFSINLEYQLVKLPFLQRFFTRVKGGLAHFLRRRGSGAVFMTGLLNGLLPCGLVYLAIAGAMAGSSLSISVGYMLAFGLGTLPLMLAATLAGQALSAPWRRRLNRLIPAFLIAFALLFIFRGLHFAVPIEMRFWETMQEVPMCH